ncbi:MAG: sulfite exporter TauE/SafE family protein [Pseudolabrys sp.]
MLLGYPIGEIALLALWIAGAGVLVGILAGLFGIGGGAIIAPVRYEVFRVLDVPEEVRMQTCIGASLAIIVPTTVRSYFGHKKKGAVIPEVVRICALPAIIGVAIGSVTASFAPAPVFKIAFLFFATFIAVRMLFGGERWKLGNELPGRGMLAIYGPHHWPILLTGRREWGRDIQRGPNAFMDGRCIRRSEHRPGSVCRSRLPVPSATCWPVGGICPFGIFLILVALRFAASMV